VIKSMLGRKISVSEMLDHVITCFLDRKRPPSFKLEPNLKKQDEKEVVAQSCTTAGHAVQILEIIVLAVNFKIGF
jgi:hypothetical protein